jgi:hypothetical protein
MRVPHPIDFGPRVVVLQEGEEAAGAAGHVHHAGVALVLALHIEINRDERLPLHCVLRKQVWKLGQDSVVSIHVS